MKNFIFSFLALVALSSCNNSNRRMAEKADPFEDISWTSEKISRYQLVQPINYDKGAHDAYGLPIRDGQWYLISKATECYLLPVYTDVGIGPSFVENSIKRNKVAILDTMIPAFMSGTKSFQGFFKINTMKVLCFKDGYSVIPSVSTL